jgi:hydroxyacylglutathione hydrolase
VLRGRREIVLIDTGYVGGYRETHRIVSAALATGRRLADIVLTHWHSDHCGGAGLLQREHGARVRAHRAEADLIRSRHPNACDALWLQHPIPPFCVDDPLEDGSAIAVDDVQLTTVHVPGQTPGHVAFFDEQTGVLVAGDMVQHGDVAWLPPLDDELSALRTAIASLERLHRLKPRIVLPGHGPPIDDPARAIEEAVDRYHRWLAAPELAAWHALNRLCVSALMIAPLPAQAPHVELARLPWLRDYAAALGQDAVVLARTLLERLASSGAVMRRGERLRAAIPFDTPDAPPPGPLSPIEWPPC